MLNGVCGVTLDRVGHQFLGRPVLRGASGRFASGCVNLIFGANGSGKTTLLRIASMQLAPTSGKVFVEADSAGGSIREVRRCVGFGAHESFLYPDLTVLENLCFAAEIFGCGRAAVERVSSLFALDSLFSRVTRTLSRGQRQRVALARALVHRPSLIVLDEPTACLDRDAVRMFVSVLRGEVSESRVILVVTHEASGFDALRTRQWILSDGRLERQRG